MLLSYRSSQEALAKVNEKFWDIHEMIKTLNELKDSNEEIKNEYWAEEENVDWQKHHVKKIRDEIESLQKELKITEASAEMSRAPICQVTDECFKVSMKTNSVKIC